MYYDKYDDNDLLRSILFFWNVFPRETPDGSWKVQNFVCGGQIELNQMGRNYFLSRKISRLREKQGEKQGSFYVVETKRSPICLHFYTYELRDLRQIVICRTWSANIFLVYNSFFSLAVAFFT